GIAIRVKTGEGDRLGDTRLAVQATDTGSVQAREIRFEADGIASSLLQPPLLPVGVRAVAVPDGENFAVSVAAPQALGVDLQPWGSARSGTERPSQNLKSVAGRFLR